MPGKVGSVRLRVRVCVCGEKYDRRQLSNRIPFLKLLLKTLLTLHAARYECFNTRARSTANVQISIESAVAETHYRVPSAST